MNFLLFNLSFRKVITFFILTIITFTFGFAAAHENDFSEDNVSISGGDKALKFVRDSILDLAVKIYLYETVLFEPSNYFEDDSVDEFSTEKRVDSLSSREFNISAQNTWSVPVDRSNVNFIPAQLFDITFAISDGAIYSLRDIVGIVTFENFGSVETEVELVYTLFDSENLVILTESDEISVQTDESFFKNFASSNDILELGDYRLVLETIYGDNVRDSFEVKFTVFESESNFLSGYAKYFIGFLLFGFLFFIFIFIYRMFFLNSDEGDDGRVISSDVNGVAGGAETSQNNVISGNTQSNLNDEIKAKVSINQISDGGGIQNVETYDSVASDDYDVEGGDKLIEDDF